MRTTRRWRKLRRKMEGGRHLKQGKEGEKIYVFTPAYVSI